MSTISASTTSTTAYKVTADTTGTLVLQTGASPTTAMTIDSSQNVGIGTSSPTQELHVYRSSGATDIMVEQASSGNAYLHTKNTSREYAVGTRTDALAFYDITADAERMRIDSSGNVGIGTSSPAGKLHIYAPATTTNFTIQSDASNLGGIFFSDGSNNTGAVVYDQASDYMYFRTNGSERARIDSSGNLLVATTSANLGFTTLAGGGGIGLAANLSANYGTAINSTNASGTQYFIGFGRNGSGCGNITSTGTNSTTYATTSDYRLKENIEPMVGALSVVQQLKPCTYTWKEDGSATQGFIAHELQAVVPEAVVGEKDAVDADGNPVYQGIDTSFLVATLTAAIQELKAELDAAKADIATLKGAA